jgi:rhamnosyltransferase
MHPRFTRQQCPVTDLISEEQSLSAANLANVLIAVVTYNPGPELIANLRALRSEAPSVVIIDNASSDQAFIDEAVASAQCSLVGNPANLGIAAALSQAAAIAQQQGFEWLATFDQDSLVRPGAIAALLDLYAEHPKRENIAIMALSHRDRATGGDYQGRIDTLEDAATWRSVRQTITSGSLVRCAVFSVVGTFDDSLFIDAVDIEFCLRCRRAGYLVIEGKQLTMDHSVGNATKYVSFGKLQIWTYNHPPQRRYYITRNNLEVVRRYIWFDALWSLYTLAYTIGSSLFVVIFEPRRAEKVRAILEGIRDFAMRRFGPRGAVKA